MKDLFMFGVNIAKAENHSNVYNEITKAIAAGIIPGKKNLRIVCAPVSDSKIATGPWPIKTAEEIVGNHPEDETTGVVFNTGFYDLSTVTEEERLTFMNGAMLKFGKLALSHTYNITFRTISEANHYCIVADLNSENRTRFDFEKRIDTKRQKEIIERIDYLNNQFLDKYLTLANKEEINFACEYLKQFGYETKVEGLAVTWPRI